MTNGKRARSRLCWSEVAKGYRKLTSRDGLHECYWRYSLQLLVQLLVLQLRVQLRVAPAEGFRLRPGAREGGVQRLERYLEVADLVGRGAALSVAGAGTLGVGMLRFAALTTAASRCLSRWASMALSARSWQTSCLDASRSSR